MKPRYAILILTALMFTLTQGCKVFREPDEGIDGTWYCEEHRSNGDVKSYYVDVKLSMKDTTMYDAYNMFDLGPDFCVHLTLIDDTVFHIVSDENAGYDVSGQGRLYRTLPMRIEWIYGVEGPRRNVSGPHRNEPRMWATYIRED